MSSSVKVVFLRVEHKRSRISKALYWVNLCGPLHKLDAFKLSHFYRLKITSQFDEDPNKQRYFLVQDNGCHHIEFRWTTFPMSVINLKIHTEFGAGWANSEETTTFF